jgi:hypothetical protein
MKTDEQIIESYQKYIGLIGKYFDEECATKIDSALGPRLAVAPRGQTAPEGGYAGGLVDYALRVAKKSKMFAEAVEQKSLVRVALIHELGKLGDDENDQLIPQDSAWHVEKLGQNYKYNEKCEKMAFVHRTLYFAAKFGLKLDTNEWIAILTSSGFHNEENRFYARDGHVLSHMMQACKCLADNELKASAKS